MTVARRLIQVEPSTSIQEVVDRIGDSDAGVEIRLGDHRYTIERVSESQVNHNVADRPAMGEAAARLIAAAGGWKGLVDAEAMKRTIYERRGHVFEDDPHEPEKL